MAACIHAGAALMSVALLFPGQGAQSPGFLRRLPKIPAVYETLERSSTFLGYNVLSLDTESALTSTMATQLSLVIAGAAFWNFLVSEGVQPHTVAGMSVGTFAAAIACGALTLEDALKLVQRRAELMQSTFEGRKDGMAVVEGLRLMQIESIVQRTGLSIANFNSPTQFIVVGPVLQLHSFMHCATEAGAFRTALLATSVPSHIPQLTPASQELLTLARQLTFQAPKITMFSNCDARPITTADGLREELAFNMANPVKWHDTMSAMAGLGITLVLEAPPGHTLAGLASETLPGVRALSAAEMRWDVLLRAAQQKQCP
jgi:malonate decarboxylase epsilon subunit